MKSTDNSREILKRIYSFVALTVSAFFVFTIFVSYISAATAFQYNFSIAGTVNETSSMSLSSSPYWWVNSGGGMILADGRGKTFQGDLGATSIWRTLYNRNNPIDTDNGLHPQNIFRLVGRSSWQNFTQEAYFRITKNNFSTSTNRSASNGLLLFNRYQDGMNLYYAGVRVDGAVVIKKKKNGTYYTMAQKKIFSGIYNRDTNPTLIPQNRWIGLRVTMKTNADNSVTVDLYLDQNWTGRWTHVLSATDDGVRYGGAPILNAGYGGIRTDFMDVEFDQYRITPF